MEQEPDYRMSLAAERTYLAYARTGLGLIAAGVALAGALPDAGAVLLRRIIGVVLVLTSSLVCHQGSARYRAVQAAMRRGEPLPRTELMPTLSWVLIGVGLAAAALIIVI